MDLNQLMIMSADMETSINFYQQLGLKLIVKSNPHYARFKCPNGNTTFSIHLSDEPISPGNTALYFEVENVDDRVMELKEIGIQFRTDPEDKPWLWREAELLDPGGHKLILFHAGENRKYPPWRLKE
ncbi:MAG: VOC family protein [Candidatus Marinimicrobia bacterium]|jgi:catechol 2,3-dioxygenase-like lactoylglutathione lyase family enzyme|nr:VOC family protein [Candidatus Neomarinimicrobiota bacterium]MBT3632869.1 VOC family protein [Candidatus Neomarinimicrobiota bacterium]MBT3681979.1 VOC family protein [Candidatus Neomarinimicrobiota bacterium]MBT3758992.1 VOC family protein [Candidatus Neomarinimicrobiota bacterium]MBT3895109.1 VOC family protein [Candidatus Neomarinimicrobiota bacterium]